MLYFRERHKTHTKKEQLKNSCLSLACGGGVIEVNTTIAMVTAQLDTNTFIFTFDWNARRSVKSQDCFCCVKPHTHTHTQNPASPLSRCSRTDTHSNTEYQNSHLSQSVACKNGPMLTPNLFDDIQCFFSMCVHLQIALSGSARVCDCCGHCLY